MRERKQREKKQREEVRESNDMSGEIVLYESYPRKSGKIRKINIELFHYACGHYGLKKMRALATVLDIKLVGDENKVTHCEACMIGKAKQRPRFKSNRIERAERPGVILHIDTAGAWATRSMSGKRFKFSVTDDFSLFIKDYYLAHKNEFVDCLKQAVAFYERQTGNLVKEIRCDQEFDIPDEVKEWWKPKQFIWKTSATGDKDGNPIAEKANDITAGVARAMRYHAQLPLSFWAEMEHAATTIHNILPAIHGPRKGKSPYEQLLSRKPILTHLRPIGCMGVMFTGKGRKGEYRGKRVMLVGYDLFRELYRVWDGRKVISGVRNARFNPFVIGKDAHPPRVVKWDGEASEGEKVSKNVNEYEHDTPNHTQTQIHEHSQTHDDEDQKYDADDEPLHNTHKTDGQQDEGEYVGQEAHHSLDSKHSTVQTQADAHHPTTTTTHDAQTGLGEPNDSLDPTDPQATHDRRAYHESQAPSKGRTWEQSDKVTEANIVHTKRDRKQVALDTESPSELKETKMTPTLSEIEGITVKVPARAWGEEWAKGKYGEGWEHVVRTGVVKEACSPQDRLKVRKQKKPTHFVQFEDELEKMLDSEIRKYKVNQSVLPTGESEHTMLSYECCMNEFNEITLFINVRVPKEIAEQGLTAGELLEGMKKELQSIDDFNTYSWVYPKEAQKAGVNKIVKLTWVHKVKLDEKGKKFVKSRLALRGDMLEPGVSYNPDQLFVPCAAHRSLLVVTKLAAWHGHKIYGLDFKNAYLNARMKDPVFAYPPEGADREGNEGKIWRIDGALYGAPQAGRRWYEILAPKLEKLGFRILDSDLCMFVEKGKFIRDAIVGIFHVDDLLFSAPNSRAYEKLATSLEKHFPLKRLGIAKEFKGIEIVQEQGRIVLHQRKYQKQVLKACGYTDARPVSTPAQDQLYEPMSESAELRKLPITSIVGSLLYLAKMTRPDIEQALNSASVMQTVDKDVTYAMLGRILRYLVKSYRGLSFHGPKSSQEAQTYPKVTLWPDAAHKVCKKTGKSRTGFVVLWGGDTVAWLSKRQSRIALSSNDAEIFAAAECIREGLAIKHIREELGIAQRGAIEVFEDNAQTILAGERGLSGPRTKHLPLEFHFIHHAQRDGEVKFVKVSTKKQIGDLLTKPLPKEQFMYLLNKFTVAIPEDSE